MELVITETENSQTTEGTGTAEMSNDAKETLAGETVAIVKAKGRKGRKQDTNPNKVLCVKQQRNKDAGTYSIFVPFNAASGTRYESELILTVVNDRLVASIADPVVVPPKAKAAEAASETETE